MRELPVQTESKDNKSVEDIESGGTNQLARIMRAKRKKVALLVCGSRPDKWLGATRIQQYRKCVETTLDELAQVYAVETLIHGDAQGADRYAATWARENKIEVQAFPANWDQHGPAAGSIRNREMAKYADIVVAFLDQRSPGTFDMLKYAKQKGLPVLKFDVSPILNSRT